MEERIGKNTLLMKRLMPGLSIKVQGMKGPIADGELPRCREFGRKVVVLLNSGEW
ncbi:MAG: hypothetical protein ACUVQ0_02275 [Thermoproteota archaeon]